MKIAILGSSPSEPPWSTSDPTLGQVSNIQGSYGRLTALLPGEFTVQAELDGKTAQITVSVADTAMTGIGVWPEETGVPVGLGVDINAYGIFSQEGLENWLTWEAVWTTSDESIATVENWPQNAGRVLALPRGVIITAASVEDFSAEALVNVPESVVSGEVGPEAGGASGQIQQFVAIGTFDNGADRDITEDVVFQQQRQHRCRRDRSFSWGDLHCFPGRSDGYRNP